MIRTTISRIKRAWVFTFAPRLLRGDQRYTPGKFKILSNLKATSSTDRGVDNGTSHAFKEPMEPKRGISDNCLSRDYFAVNESMDAIAKRHGAPPLYYSTSSCRCDECNKVIAEIFGTETKDLQETDPKGGGTLSNTEVGKMTANVGHSRVIEDDIQQTNADAIVRNTTHYIAAPAVKTEEPAVFETYNQQATENNSGYRENYKTMLWYEAVLKECKDKSLDISAQQINENDEMYTNLYDVDPEECESHTMPTSDQLCEEYNHPSQISNWDEVYETALGENSVSSEPNDTVNVYNVAKCRGIPVDDPYVDPRLRTYYPQNVDKLFEDSSLQEKLYLTSTTEHDDQKLTQKLEKLEELPVVPTEKPPIDGLHSPPKALNNTSESEDTLDEVAKRCLTTPCDQIDKVLLKEMENIGIPLSMQNSACGIKIDNIQDPINKPKKVTPKKEIELGNPRETVSPNAKALNNLSGLQLHAVPQVENQIDVKKVKEQNEKSDSESKAQHVNTKGKTKWLHWRVDKDKQKNEEKRQNAGQSGTAEHESKVNFGDWNTDQLHPKHVLTCNETCPISPKPLMTTNSIKVEDTEVIFERDFYENENLQKADYMRLIPLLEVGYKNSEGKSCTDASTKVVCANETLKHDSKTTQFSEKKKQSQLESDACLKIPQKNIHEAKEEFETVSDDSLDVTNESYVIEATSEQLQATSEQLQVASEQLKATCEQLKGTSVKLLATSDHLYDSSDKLQAASANLYDTSEKLQDASTRLLDTSERIECEISNLINTIPNNAYKRRQIIEEVDSVDKCGFMITPVANAKDKSENPKTIKVPPTISDSNKHAKINVDNPFDNVIKDKMLIEEGPNSSDIRRESKETQIQGLAQQAAAVSPEPSIEPLPEIKDNMKLSEVLSIVRKRNRQSMSIKGPRKDIPPLSRPLHIPPSFRMPTANPPAYPMHRTCPPPKTGKTKPKLNFSCVDEHLSVIDEVYIDQEELEAAILEEEPPTDFAEDFIRQLQSVRSRVESSYKRGKTDILESVMVAKTSTEMKYYRNKDYEPWVPIPSWPYHKKKMRPKMQCPQDGCKIPPPRSEQDLPCGLKPCKTFPTFPKRTFSVLDYYPVTVGKHKVVDFGEF